MLELCFDMSTRGALRVAQRCGGSGRKGFGFVLSRTEDGGNVTSTTVIGFDDGKAPAGEEIHQIQRAQRRQAALEREAIPLGGSPSDVLVLSLGLDMGDIREPLGADRWDLLRRWCDGDDETTDRDWQRNLEAAERLRSCGSRDAVRIWVDHTPYGACGLLHAASLLKDTKADVRVVFLPPWRERPDGVVETYLGWGEVEPELFGRFLSREEPLPPVKVTLGSQATVQPVPGPENKLLLEKAKAGTLSQSVTLEPAVQAPVAAGDRLGTLTITVGEETVAELPLLAGEAVPRITFRQMLPRVWKLACLAGG